MGLDYCCGGKVSVVEACARQGISVESLAAQLAEADAAGGMAPEPDWTAVSVAELCDHIVETHHTYMESELPRIAELSAKVAQAHGALHPEVIVVHDTFMAMRDELAAHLRKEEAILFPIIRRLDEADGPVAFHCGSVANPISAMEYEHDSAGRALATMRSATGGFGCPEGVCSAYRALMDALQQMELDLHLHIHKENNILFPRAIAREVALAGR